MRDTRPLWVVPASVTIAGMAAFALVGCVDSPRPTPVRSSHAATPVRSEPTDEPTLMPTAPATPATAQESAAAGFIWLTDGGQQPNAEGKTRRDAQGHVLWYTVVSGDTFNGIETRFNAWNLWSFNCARRQDTNLFVGDVINLDPYTVASVGSEHGTTTASSPGARQGCLWQTGLPPQH